MTQAAVAPPAAAPPLPTVVVYAGFWLRLLAMIVDTMIFLPAVLIVIGLFVVLVPEAMQKAGPVVMVPLMGAYVLLMLAAMVGVWLYYTLMESSRHQATLGKMVLGIVVTDLDGNRISRARANGRYFGKSLSGFLLNFGFLMAGFTAKKQALHDLISGCLVVKK